MQLDYLVDFHKALADPNRLKIIMLLAGGRQSGQEIAQKLGLTPSTVTHHMNLLRDVALVKGEREKNTIYFELNEKQFHQKHQALVGRVNRIKRASGGTAGERERVIQNFFDADGRLKTIPAQRKKKMLAFEHMLEGLEVAHPYTEKEINEYIKQFHEDYATIRREFVMNHYMHREEGIYVLNPPELWMKIE
jgi:hypothetical protein